MPSKTYRSDRPVSGQGEAALQSFIEFNKKPAPPICEYQDKGIIPFEFASVWQILLETEFFGRWLDDHDRQDAFLPDLFGPGQEIVARNTRFNFAPSYVINCSPPGYSQHASLTIARPFYPDYPAYFYQFDISPYERYSTKLAIRVYSSTQIPTVVRIREQIFGKAKVNYFQAELERSIEGVFLRFSQLCHDRINYGPVFRAGYSTWNGPYWAHYTGSDGIVNFYPGPNGEPNPQPGEFIKAGERIGFVSPVDGGQDLEKWKEQNYIEPGNGYVRQVLKKHREAIGHRERVLLLSKSADTDLGLTAISMEENGYIDPPDSYYAPKLTEYFFEEGQLIKQGDSIAIFKSYGEREKFELKSTLSGILAERLVKPGAEVSIKSAPLICLRVAKAG